MHFERALSAEREFTVGVWSDGRSWMLGRLGAPQSTFAVHTNRFPDPSEA
jgi:hypothetical protein